jgi:hypothetical protein
MFWLHKCVQTVTAGNPNSSFKPITKTKKRNSKQIKLRSNYSKYHKKLTKLHTILTSHCTNISLQLFYSVERKDCETYIRGHIMSKVWTIKTWLNWRGQLCQIFKKTSKVEPVLASQSTYSFSPLRVRWKETHQPKFWRCRIYFMRGLYEWSWGEVHSKTKLIVIAIVESDSIMTLMIRPLLSENHWKRQSVQLRN